MTITESSKTGLALRLQGTHGLEGIFYKGLRFSPAPAGNTLALLY